MLSGDLHLSAQLWGWVGNSEYRLNLDVFKIFPSRQTTNEQIFAQVQLSNPTAI